MNNTNFNDSVAISYIKATESNPYQRVIVCNHLFDSMGDISNMNILDVGCGFGRHIKYIIDNSSSFNRLVGIDKSNDQINKCIDTFKVIDRGNLQFYSADIIDNTIFSILDKNTFDIVYNNFVISYCANTKEIEIFLKNCYELLNPGGKFILIYNNHKNGLLNNPKVYDILRAGARPLTENGEFYEGCPIESIMSSDCKVILNFYSEELLTSIMNELGFKDFQVRNVYLKEKILEFYSKEELDIIIDSKIFVMITGIK
jgi:SAM-dependent methyltransferase